PPPGPLDLDPESMRRLGYRVVDTLVERLARLDQSPAWQGASRPEMEARLREAPPAAPRDFHQLLDRLLHDVLPYAGRIDHPRFFAFIPSCPTWPGVLGDFLASGFNIFQGTWLESAGPSALELVVLDWFKEWIGYPAEAAGLLLSGGSAANLTALACARQTRLGAHSERAVVYLSQQGHSSMERAARILGFRPSQVRVLPVDHRFRIRIDAFRAALEQDRQAGLEPFLAVANAGATSTGAIDPLPELAALAAEQGVWLHVDAAYGGFAVLTERGREWLRGLEQAHSITLDPHKWLFQPYEAGCLLIREGRRLTEAFHVLPDYLQDTTVAGAEVNFGDRGIQLSRAARGLKIWLSIQCFGVDAFRTAIDRALDLALLAQKRIEASPALELLAPAMLGVVCFRRILPGAAVSEELLERVNAELVSRLAQSGLGMISSTRIDGRYAPRLCIMNHRSRLEDVERVLDWLETAPLQLPDKC
ncbi:MAG: aminotransferase class I/II-fold pyridoxal phosphate-dependent enzyme, partial [Gemmatimonadetes bacterium]|nr:aminotransferase class I/II-fold pyridoxal phosphate-dependent enzyme [Gemmatimonadota bacterium]